MTHSMSKRLIVLAALMLAATAAEAGIGGCYTANVPGTLVLPDGSKHAPGILRICNDRVISPVSNLHRSFVDGHPAGMFLSVPREIEERLEPGAAQIIFVRGDGAELHLVGYLAGSRNGTTLYELSRGEIAPAARHRAGTDGGRRDGMVVLVASAR